MAITAATDLAAGQLAMVGTARYTLEFKTLTAKLFQKEILAQGEKSLFYPKFGTVEAKDLTDGVDMTEAQSLTLAGTTHTTDEAGCKVIITKKLRHQLKENAYRAAGKVIGTAMSKKIDKDGLTLFSGLSTGLGAAGSTFSIDLLRASVSQMIGKSEPNDISDLSVVLHPYQYDELINDIATPGTNNMPPNLQDATIKTYLRGFDKLFGVPIYATGNISVDTIDDAYGAIFAKMCFLYIVGWEPETWVEEDKSLRGWEIGIVADYSMVEEDDGYGKYLLYDATAPVA